MLTLVVASLLLSSISGFTAEKTLYGGDNRIAYADSKNETHKLWARSTAAMINRWLIKDGATAQTKRLDGWTLEHARNVCSDEKFSGYTSNAFCSGFLVAEDILVTAGHCVRNQFMCDEHQWVFDYRQDLMPSGDDNAVIQVKNMYKCKEIIKLQYSATTKMDYAVIRLDRKVTDRAPLKFRTEGKVPTSSTLVAIGHPSGIPTVITPNGKVRYNHHPVFFTTTLDTFGGNSGSAVINERTGVVEGILVRGDHDYELDEGAGCDRPVKCKFTTCNGEEVTRITNIKILKDLR